MKKTKSKKLFLATLSILFILGVIFYIQIISNQQSPEEVQPEEWESVEDNGIEDEEEVIFEDHKPKSQEAPKEINAIYVSGWSASREDYIEEIIRFTQETSLNAIVLDVKDSSGYLTYESNLEEVIEYGAYSRKIRDIKGLLERLKEEDIYLIGRVTFFQDPVLSSQRPDLAIKSKADPDSLWYDRSRLSWVDPSSKEVWDYNIAVAKEAIELGFDEINLDYVRFPSDGLLSDMSFPLWDENTPRNVIIGNFFEYVRQEMPNDKLSVDLFGLVSVSYGDLGIGQIAEDSFKHFDYISPMIYPSHYAMGFLGYENPAKHPYEVVHHSLVELKKRLSLFKETHETKAQIRPWLQDFNLGAVYDADMVKLQIKATRDALGEEFNGFMLWSSSNRYTEEALSSY